MSFFEPPPPAPEPEQSPPAPWHGPPANVLGVPVALSLLLARTDVAAIAIPSATVYPDGFVFTVEVRCRDEELLQYQFRHHGSQVRGPLPAELLRYGLEFGDGRRATNLGLQLTFQGGAEPPPIVLAPRGGGGGNGVLAQELWVWPLPPAGPLAFVCEWPAAGISLTRTEIDSARLTDQADGASELWPAAEAPSGGAGTTMQFVRSAALEKRPGSATDA